MVRCESKISLGACHYEDVTAKDDGRIGEKLMHPLQDDTLLRFGKVTRIAGEDTSIETNNGVILNRESGKYDGGIATNGGCATMQIANQEEECPSHQCEERDEQHMQDNPPGRYGGQHVDGIHTIKQWVTKFQDGKCEWRA